MKHLEKIEEMQLCVDYLNGRSFKEIMKEYLIGSSRDFYKILDRYGVKRLNQYKKQEK